MADVFVIAVDDVEGWFKKVFANAPKKAAIALAVLNSAAPAFEVVVALVDPALAVVADPIITQIQADMGTVAAMLKNNQITSVGAFLTAIKSNFTTLLTEAKITDPASVAKANVFLGVIASVASELSVAI